MFILFLGTFLACNGDDVSVQQFIQILYYPQHNWILEMYWLERQ